MAKRSFLINREFRGKGYKPLGLYRINRSNFQAGMRRGYIRLVTGDNKTVETFVQIKCTEPETVYGNNFGDSNANHGCNTVDTHSGSPFITHDDYGNESFAGVHIGYHQGFNANRVIIPNGKIYE